MKMEGITGRGRGCGERAHRTAARASHQRRIYVFLRTPRPRAAGSDVAPLAEPHRL